MGRHFFRAGYMHLFLLAQLSASLATFVVLS
jgi:hypothetical protein